MHRIFYTDDIVRLIVSSLAEDARGDMLEGLSDDARRSKSALASLARVCRRFYPTTLEGLLLDLHDHEPLLSLLRESDNGSDAQKRDIITRKSRSVWFRRVDEWTSNVQCTSRDPITRVTLPVRELSWICGPLDEDILDISALNLPYLREVCVRGGWDRPVPMVCRRSVSFWQRLQRSLQLIAKGYPELETLRIRWDDLFQNGSTLFFEMFPPFENLKHPYLVIDRIHTNSAVVMLAKLQFLRKLSIRCAHRRIATSVGTMSEATEGFQSLRYLILEEMEIFMCRFIGALPSCPLTELTVRVQDCDGSSTQHPPTNLAGLIAERFGSLQKLYFKSAYPSIFSEEFFSSLCRLDLATVKLSGVAAELLKPELFAMIARSWPRLEELEICVRRESNSTTEVEQEETVNAEDSAICYFKDHCPRLHSFSIR